MATNDNPSSTGSRPGSSSEPATGWRDVPIDWEALEDAFENNAPEVHSYLHVPTGDVLRIVDGIADPQMHARIAADANYLRIEPVSSREQYRWMERYIPMVEDDELQAKLTRAIDGKGAFRRFKDVLMSYGPERERWFAFRSERLRIFMEAWLNAHALNPVKRPMWMPDMVPPEEQPKIPGIEVQQGRASRGSESFRKQLQDIIGVLGSRELETLAAFGEFLRARCSGDRGSRPGSVPPRSRPSRPSSPGARDQSSRGSLASSAGIERSGSDELDDDDEQPSSRNVAKGRRTVASGEE